MANKSQMLSDAIHVESRFQRSINLEKDYSVKPDGDRYIVTPTARKALRRILEGLEGDGPCRAMTLTGPYGVGKSAFALFMSRLLCGDTDSRQAGIKKLHEAEPALAQAFSEYVFFEKKTKGLLPILITGRRAPASLCIMETIAETLAFEKSVKLRRLGVSLRNKIRKLNMNEPIDTRNVTKALSLAANAAINAGYAGSLVVIDELGKLFEYAARDSRKGDVYVLQEIAELASRSSDAPIVVIGLLHQGFDEYARHLDLTTRQEWTKIQGRFTDIAFQEPTEQVVRLIAAAISWTSGKPSASFTRELKRLVKESARNGLKLPILSESEFQDIACRCYPLHPSTLVALPILFNRFAQNERSLFSYLSSLEPGGFQEFIRTNAHTTKSPPFIRLPQLFDYFTSNFGAGLYRQPYARRWLEAADALDRTEELTKVHRDVVKTIGMLSVLGEFSHLRATKAVLAMALNDRHQMSASVKDAMDELQAQSLITYRKFNETYRVWEGSDIDIEARISEGERKVSRIGLASIVQKYVVTRPLVTRRHNFETGALRYFDLFYTDRPDDIECNLQSPRRADGRVVVCLAETNAAAHVFCKQAIAAGDRHDIVFAIPQQIGDLRSAALELAALHWAWEHTLELRDDRVARREIALRISEAEQLLTRNLNGLLDPRPEPIGSSCIWVSGGKQHKMRNRAGISQLLSTICDDLFKLSPKIRNELVARRSLSTAATRARRNLVEGMLFNAEHPTLGIEGFPPERSMYESFLAQTGIHSQREDGNWGFSPPNGQNDHNLLPCWAHLCSIVFNRQPEPIPIDDLFSELNTSPIGLMAGLHPLMLCVFMLVYPDETTLYREGRFIPEPSMANFEILMRRPELFALAGSRVSGGRAAVVNRLARGLKEKPTTVNVVRALFRMVSGLPDFAKHTHQLPARALALRQAFNNAKSPERFLFVEAPEALDVESFSDEKPNRVHVEAFFKALNENIHQWASVAPSTINNARDVLLHECGYQSGETGWQALRSDAVQIEPSVTESQLLTFIRRLVQTAPDSQGIESVLALVANRPPRSWSDTDVERFPDVAKVMGTSFSSAKQSMMEVESGKAQIQAFGRKDRKDAEQLLSKLRTYLKRPENRSKPEVIRAVVSILAAEFQELISNG